METEGGGHSGGRGDTRSGTLEGQGGRTEVPIESANRGSVGVFVRTFWRPGESPGVGGEMRTSEAAFKLLRTPEVKGDPLLQAEPPSPSEPGYPISTWGRDSTAPRLPGDQVKL